jgi:hypothetical protein
MSEQDDTRLPEQARRGRWGLVRGVVRVPSGEPVEGCAVFPDFTTPPAHPVRHKAARTTADGYYELGLPAATYTMKANGRTASGTSVYGETPGVEVTVGRTVTTDITVTDREN